MDRFPLTTDAREEDLGEGESIAVRFYLDKVPMTKFAPWTNDCERLYAAAEPHRGLGGYSYEFNHNRVTFPYFHTKKDDRVAPVLFDVWRIAVANAVFSSEIRLYTGNKYYDVVVACLIAAKRRFGHHARTVYAGGNCDIPEACARILCQRVLGCGADFGLELPKRWPLRGLRTAYVYLTNGEYAGHGHAAKVHGTSSGSHSLVTRSPYASGKKYLVVHDFVRGVTVAEHDDKEVCLWHATCLLLSRSLHRTNDEVKDPFMRTAMLRVGDWSAFGILADKLEEDRNPDAGVLRHSLPRDVPGSA